MKRIFSLLKANVVRTRTPISAIFLSIYNKENFNENELESIEQAATRFLESIVRQTDIVHPLSDRSPPPDCAPSNPWAKQTN